MTAEVFSELHDQLASLYSYILLCKMSGSLGLCDIAELFLTVYTYTSCKLYVLFSNCKSESILTLARSKTVISTTTDR